MNHSKFLMEVKTLLEKEIDSVSLAQPLTSHALWDSLAIVSVIALADTHYGVTLTIQNLNDCSSLNDILAQIEVKAP